MTPGAEIRCQARIFQSVRIPGDSGEYGFESRCAPVREQNILNVYNDGGETRPEVDPEHPREPHDTHEWLQLPRWAECTVCGVRDYWAGATQPCAKPKKGTKPEKTLTLELACARIRSDVEAFEWWWKSKDLGSERPSLDEWFAEFSEWRRVATANY